MRASKKALHLAFQCLFIVRFLANFEFWIFWWKRTGEEGLKASALLFNSVLDEYLIASVDLQCDGPSLQLKQRWQRQTPALSFDGCPACFHHDESCICHAACSWEQILRTHDGSVAVNSQVEHLRAYAS